MDVQDVFIQKKLLYKFDKKIELLFQSLYMLSENSQSLGNDKMLDETQQNDKKLKYLSKQAILEQIEQLKFQNFKYRTALISAKKDQTSNEQILKKAQEEIVDSKREVESLSRQLELSLRCKRNKEEYNQLVESLKSSFEPLSVQNDKLSTITKEIDEMEKKYEKEVVQHEKKQKCLRLALSALKCVIQNEDGDVEPTAVTNGSLYQVQGLTAVSEPKVAQPILNSVLYNGEINGNLSSRQEGEQLEGGQILY